MLSLRTPKKILSLLLSLMCTFLFAEESQKKLKVLHLSFHQGLVKEVEGLAEALSFDLESWQIADLPPYFFDPKTTGAALYNIGHDRAQRIWEKHKDYFNRFDVILTSDTAPLARIFLQNGFQKPLIVWICNRFDYYDGASLDCDFPDPEFYELFKKAKDQRNVILIAYTPFEHRYAASKGVDTGSLVIKPCSPDLEEPSTSDIPPSIHRSEIFHLTPRHNEMNFMNLSDFLKKKGIDNYCGRYHGPADLKDFKGVIHLPYGWSNLALFENMQMGIPYFVPSQEFFRSLLKKKNYWFQDRQYLSRGVPLHLAEWYCEENKEALIYFHSWEDLAQKVKQTNYEAQREKVKACGRLHRTLMLERWQQVFDQIRNFREREDA